MHQLGSCIIYSTESELVTDELEDDMVDIIKEYCEEDALEEWINSKD